MGAGLGFKTFVTGDVLTATDTNGYLMQGVWVFADAAARSAAVTSPQEGNMSFLKDTNSTEYYSGSAWVAVGGSSSNNFYAGKNALINGAYQVWQRGTSISNFGFFSLYTADRWNFVSTNTGRTISRQLTGDTTNLPNIQYCARVQRDSGNTNTTYYEFSQSIETLNSIRFAGKSVTLSFYARKGANYSPTSNVLTFSVKSGTGTDQVIGGYTGSVDVINTTATLTTTWQRFTATGTVATNATELGVIFRADPTGTAGAADYFEVTGVQLEAGSTATDFQTASGSIGGELALCQRYYYRTSPSGAGAPLTVTGGIITTTIAQVYMPLPVTMRANPSTLDYSSVDWYNFGNNTTYNGGTYTLTAATLNNISLRYTHGSAVFTAGQVGAFVSNGTSAYLGFGAEL
jgi:hypothetical protein